MAEGRNLPVALRDARERAIAILSDGFTHGALDLDEFETRLTRAHGAANVAELEKLVADLPETTGTPAEPAAKPETQTALVPVSQVRQKQWLVAVFGGSERKGTWNAPKRIKVVTVFGGATIDFREARLPVEGVDLSIFAMMGGVEIIVPPELPVDMSGVAFMGGFEHMARTPVEPEPGRPVLRVGGFAMMGGVSVETRLVGESAGDARRRRRRERKERKEREKERGA
jgi:hypothetical protein